MQPVVVVSGDSFRNEIRMGRHVLIADEPETAGGTDEGPAPYELLSAALGTCTSMTLHWVAKRDAIPLEGVEIEVSHDRMNAKDCVPCESKSGYIHHFDVRIRLRGTLTDEQRTRLAEAANRCPIYKTLQSEIRIDETFVA